MKEILTADFADVADGIAEMLRGVGEVLMVMLLLALVLVEWAVTRET